MAESGITVTVTDHETGDTETMPLTDYVIVCGSKRIAGEQHYANGTTVLTLKPVPPDGEAG